MKFLVCLLLFLPGSVFADDNACLKLCAKLNADGQLADGKLVSDCEGACKKEIEGLDPNKIDSKEYSEFKAWQKSKENLAQTPSCVGITKLKVGMTKNQVAKMFGEPTYSKMMTCGGVNGIATWSCEQVTYKCRNAETSYDSTVSITYSGNRVNNWE